MLTSVGEVAFAGGKLRSLFLLARRVRAHLARRHRLLFDARFGVPSGLVESRVSIYLQLGGTLAVDGARSHEAGLLVLADDEFERARIGTRSFRSWGDPCVTLDLRLPREAVACPVGLSGGIHPVTAGARAALERLVTCLDHAPLEGAADALRGVAAALVDDGLLARDGVDVFHDEPEPPSLVRTWSFVAPLVARHEMSPHLATLADGAGLSLRQLTRDVGQLCERFGLLGGTFREAALVLRLREAVVLLSAPDATVAAVARRVGYGSPEAMARAFRDAGLPAPSEVRERVRYADLCG